MLLRLSYVPSSENSADLPSRRISMADSRLGDQEASKRVEACLGGLHGISCDLMALDSNVMKNNRGESLPHFTPHPSPESLGAYVFAQDLTRFGAIMRNPYVFPPMVLVGPLLRFLQGFRQSCTMMILDIYPRKYWWPLVQNWAVRSYKIAVKGDTQALVCPSRHGWCSHPGRPGDLWAFRISFS